MTALPVLLPVVPLIAGVLSVLVGLWRPARAQSVAIAGATAAFALAVVGLASVVGAEPIRHELGGWPPPIGIEYVLDPLAGYLATVVTGIGLLAVVYPMSAGFQLAPRPGLPIYGLVMVLLGGLLGVVISGDLFHLFVFLEIFAIATYALVATGGDRAVFASFRYLLIGTVGSGMYLLGVGFVYFSTGTLNMADAAARLPELAESPAIVAAAVLVTVGLGVKMALFPLHVWLPDAHTNAPPAVAALLAAVQVKVAAYALVRVLYGVFDVSFIAGDLPIATALTAFGAVGIVVGSAMAIVQTDFKRLLAYSTVAQLGYIGVGIGLATPLALAAALLHVLNHAAMKSCLFFIAGGIYDQTHVKEIDRFSGLGRRMPLLMGAFTIAVLSMAGVPPTAGFFSKFYLVAAAMDAGSWVVAAVVVGSSLLTATYFLRIIEQVFLGDPHPATREAVEPPVRVLGPVALLAVALLVIGVANLPIVERVLTPIAQGLLGA